MRKKSTKVLEMEEAEKLEKKMSKKDSLRQPGHSSKRQRTKSSSGYDAMSANPNSSVGTTAGDSATAGTSLEEVAGFDVTAEPKPAPALGSLISKLKMTLGNPPSVEEASTSIVKKNESGDDAEGALKIKLSLSPTGEEALIISEPAAAPKGKKRKATAAEGEVGTWCCQEALNYPAT